MCHWKVLFWTCHQRNSNRIFILITVIFHVCHKIITCYVIYWFTVIFVDPALVVCHNFVYRYPFSLYSDIFFYRKHLFGFSNVIKSMLTGLTILLKQTFICNREKRCGVQCDRFVFFLFSTRLISSLGISWYSYFVSKFASSVLTKCLSETRTLI